ncbi:gas vesicle protein GvpA/GvpJ/GvpM family [Anaerobacterium chartisolvens]|uniref:Gas vesicle protein GvpA/GvpJ/GvpM family n=1 Tax=Anaerobacterium chartisolvens TaxID=1297424 RepID=A0A369AQ98_9FIRM|nr:gas vesicle protein GvpJ [Anaerobacterium chartisolvens]RCX10508.1 gas vesicle protein GvpA/GvpJ/GvpM family [Anaerobacterium chartisolvens]
MSVRHSVESSSLAEVLDRILEKGIVIDIFVRASLLGIELLTADVRIVIAGVETWLCYARAVGLSEEHYYKEG